MPKTWPAEALKSQAVAARSYALAQRKTSGPFDVYPDTRSQVYGGVSAEAPTDHRRPSTRPQARCSPTAGRSRRRTSSRRRAGAPRRVADVWKSARRSRTSSPSPTRTTRSRRTTTGGRCPFTRGQAREGAQGPGAAARRPDDGRTAPSASDTLRAIGDEGRARLTPARTSARRSACARRWFSVGVLALDPLPATTLAYGAPFTLTGLGRGLARPAPRAAGRRDGRVGAESRDRARRRRLVLGHASRPPRPSRVPRHERDRRARLRRRSSSRRASR